VYGMADWMDVKMAAMWGILMVWLKVQWLGHVPAEKLDNLQVEWTDGRMA